MERILFENGIVMTVDDNNTLYRKGYVLVEGSRIAALGEGRTSQGIFVCGKTRRVYSRAEVPPVQSTRDIRLDAINAGISFGTGFLMLASLAPVMSQEYSTSHSARRWRSMSAIFSSREVGAGSSSASASAGQKRFCGCA